MPNREISGAGRAYDLKWAVNAGLFIGHYFLFLVNGYDDSEEVEVVKRELEKCFAELGFVPDLPDANPNGGYPINQTRALEKQLRERIKKTIDNRTANLFSLVGKFSVYSLTGGAFPEESKQMIMNDARPFARATGIDEDTVSDYLERLLVEEDSRKNVLKEFVDWINSEIDRSVLEAPQFQSSTADQYDLFISYSSVDEREANEIFDLVKARGLKAFLAVKGIQSGDDFAEEIRKGLINSTEICILVTPKSLGSEWVATEWGAAWVLKKRITPILLRCDVNQLPQRLQNLQCIDFHHLEQYIDQVLSRIKGPNTGNLDS